MESYIIHLDFSATFDSASHSDLLFKLKSIGVGSSVLSICRELLSNRRQRVVVDGATSDTSKVEWSEASLVRLGPLWWHWPIGYVSSFS